MVKLGLTFVFAFEPWVFQRRISSQVTNMLEVSNVLATGYVACDGVLVGPLDFLLFEHFMKPSSLVAIASLSWALVSCTGTTPVTPVDKPVKSSQTSSKNDGHKAPSEPTQAIAGAAKCTLQNVQQIGALAKNGGLAIGFGEHGGLAAWGSPEGFRVKTVSSAGLATGSSTPITFPKGSQPVEIAAVTRGYAIIAKRIETTTGPCESACGDKPCPEAKPGEAPAQTCEKPTGHEFFIQLTDMDGKNASAGRPFHTGLVDIEKTLLGDGRAFGVLTKNEVVFIAKRPDNLLDAERVEFPSGQTVLPVYGFGPPAVLLVDQAGGMQLLDERGVNEIQGKFIGMPVKAAPAAAPTPAPAPKPGATAKGKPPAAPPSTAGKPPAAPVPAPAPPVVKPGAEVIFRVQWGPKGRLDVGRRIGETTQYAVIEKLVLRILNDSESQEIRDSFAKAVDVHMEGGKLRRTGWDKRSLGEDIDVHQADPAANVERTRAVWTGSVFVFAHPSTPAQHPEAPSFGILTATCGSAKP